MAAFLTWLLVSWRALKDVSGPIHGFLSNINLVWRKENFRAKTTLDEFMHRFCVQSLNGLIDVDFIQNSQHIYISWACGSGLRLSKILKYERISMWVRYSTRPRGNMSAFAGLYRARAGRSLSAWCQGFGRFIEGTDPEALIVIKEVGKKWES